MLGKHYRVVLVDDSSLDSFVLPPSDDSDGNRLIDIPDIENKLQNISIGELAVYNDRCESFVNELVQTLPHICAHLRRKAGARDALYQLPIRMVPENQNCL